MKTPLRIAGAVMFVAACSDATSMVPSTDAASDAASDVASVDAAGDVVTDDAVRSDVAQSDGAVGDAPGDACAASDAGSLQTNYYCDFGAIHVLRHDGAPTEVEVQGRVGTTSGCGVIDSIELFVGSTSLGRITTTETFTTGQMGTTLARTVAPSALEGQCANESTRLSGYGFVARGRDARGPFEARCGTAASGSRWPPGTYLACQRNLDRAPLSQIEYAISQSSFSGMTSAMFYLRLPHAPGRPAATTFDGTLDMVSPANAPFSSGPPVMAARSTGWMGLVSESTTESITQVSFLGSGTMPPVPMALCPAPSTGTPPMTLPPFFIARMQGTSAVGTIVVETLASCTTTSLRP